MRTNEDLLTERLLEHQIRCLLLAKTQLHHMLMCRLILKLNRNLLQLQIQVLKIFQRETDTLNENRTSHRHCACLYMQR